MDLWIRSQDKEILLKANEIRYEHYKPFWSDYRIHAIILNDRIIQEYKTKERALEVLNEISYIMLPTKDGFDENGNYDGSNCFATDRMMYYEMPVE